MANVEIKGTVTENKGVTTESSAALNEKLAIIAEKEIEIQRLTAENTRLSAEYSGIVEEKEEAEASLQEAIIWNSELQAEIASVKAQLETYQTSIQSDTSSQTLVLRKMEKLAQTISEQESQIESNLDGLSEEEKEVVKTHRNDKINEHKRNRDQLRSILRRGASE